MCVISDLRALGRRGDVLVGISTSGRSSSVLAALRGALELEITAVSLTGDHTNRHRV